MMDAAKDDSNADVASLKEKMVRKTGDLSCINLIFKLVINLICVNIFAMQSPKMAQISRPKKKTSTIPTKKTRKIFPEKNQHFAAAKCSE